MSGIYIKIPKEFEEHFRKDRFEDSLHRLSADAHLLAGLYERETAAMLIESFKNAILVPPHGRLSDADALFKEFERRGWYNNADRDLAEDYLLDFPTVIPEERSKE